MGIKLKTSPYIVGIDLGTSTSSAAVYLKGEPRLVKFSGQKNLPSVVHVRENGDVVVGSQAKAKILVDPTNTVTSIKREMGNDTYEKEFSGLPDRKFTPTDISAEILKAIRRGLIEFDDFDLQGGPKFAVICVPANFDDRKKTATREAAALAEFEVLHLLEEPVAAAIAYGFEKDRDQTILVYDLGGGTFDVSVLEVDTASVGSAGFKVLAKEGIPELGGDDFDRKIMELVSERFQAEANLNVLDLKKDQGIAVRSLREANQKLKEAAEIAKKELTDSQSTEILIPSFIKNEEGLVLNLEQEITRSEFEDAIQDLILDSKTSVEKALQSAQLTIEDISRIVLVGGSTRVPLIKQMLTEMFDKEPYSDMDPDTIVCLGAAVFGAALPEQEVESEDDVKRDEVDKIGKTFLIDNKVTHNLGIELYGRKFDTIIGRNTELPHDNPVVVFTKKYTTPRDNMTELTISVYQASGEAEFVTDETCVWIGELIVTGIPPAPAGSEKISVKFEIDGQNLLKVEATSLSDQGESISLEISRK